jgi:hypothetical protein
MDAYRLIIIAPVGTQLLRDIPLLPGQEITNVEVHDDLVCVNIDLGDERLPTKAQYNAMMQAGVKQFFISRAKQRSSSWVFGFLLMVTALGVAAFLNPHYIPWIAAAFMISGFVLWLKEP